MTSSKESLKCYCWFFFGWKLYYWYGSL